MKITCKLYGPPREMAGSKCMTCRVGEEATIGDVLEALSKENPDLESWLYEESDTLGESVGILVNGRNVSRLDGLATPVSSIDEVLITPPVHGG